MSVIIDIMEGLDNEIEFVKKEIPDLKKFITNIINSAYKMEGLDESLITYINIVSPEEIREINLSQRNIDKATDVLSFPMYEPKEFDDPDFEVYKGASYPISLGDMVINMEQIIYQSKEYETGIVRELAYMIVHSFYHLLGHDHMEEIEKMVMRKKEETLLKELGYERKEME